MIEMDKWDYKNPILELPLRHVNMLEFMKTIESFVKMSSSRRDVQRHIQGMDDMSALLTNLFSLISSKLRDVNLAHMEVILAATLIRDSVSCVVRGSFRASHSSVARIIYYPGVPTPNLLWTLPICACCVLKTTPMPTRKRWCVN